MKQEERSEFAAFIQAVAEVTPGQPPSPQAVYLYFDLLKDLTLEEVKRNIGRSVINDGRFPTIPAMRGKGWVDLEQQTIIAWELFVDAVDLPDDENRKQFFTLRGFDWLTNIYWRYYQEYLSGNRASVRKHVMGIIRAHLDGRQDGNDILVDYTVGLLSGNRTPGEKRLNEVLQEVSCQSE